MLYNEFVTVKHMASVHPDFSFKSEAIVAKLREDLKEGSTVTQ